MPKATLSFNWQHRLAPALLFLITTLEFSTSVSLDSLDKLVFLAMGTAGWGNLLSGSKWGPGDLQFFYATQLWQIANLIQMEMEIALFVFVFRIY